MMPVDWTIRLGDILMALVTVGIIPLARAIHKVLSEMRDDIRDLRHIVVGPERDEATGLVAKVEGLRTETRKHRDRLIRLESEASIKIDDRT